MDHAAENARLHEFLASKGLQSEFCSYLAAHDRSRKELGTPEIDVSYEKNFSRSGREESVNITPWLRNASFEDACRFARLARDGYDSCNQESSDDGRFLTRIIESCVDEDEREWMDRAHSIRVMLYFVAETLTKVLPEVRPADHGEVAEHLASKEPA